MAENLPGVSVSKEYKYKLDTDNSLASDPVYNKEYSEGQGLKTFPLMFIFLLVIRN